MATGETGLRAVVVGGSLGGLTTALLLRDAGFDVNVYERSYRPLDGQGAGIVLHPATNRYLVERTSRRLDEMAASAVCVRYLDDAGDVAHERASHYQFTSYFALHRELLAAFDRSRYHLDSEVVDLHQRGDEVTVHFADGRTRSCDLLICADGIHSTGRKVLIPEVEPRYAGYVAWRGTVGEEELSARTFDIVGEAIVYHVMPDSHILAYPIPNADGDLEPGRRLTNWVWYRNVAAGRELDELMTDRDGNVRPISLPAGDVRDEHLGELRRAAASLPGPLAEMVGKSQAPFVQAVHDVEVPRMAFGRIAIVGDAAFAIRPHAAAGTAKAAENAWRLVDALAPVASQTTRIPAALAAWEPGQLELGRSVLDRTRRAGARYQFEGSWRVGEPLPFGLYEDGDTLTEPEAAV